MIGHIMGFHDFPCRGPIIQMKADISRAIAVTITVRRLPFRSSERKRPHNLVCAFHAIPRRRLGAASTFGCSSRLARRISIAPGSTRIRRAHPLPALVMPPRLTLSPVEFLWAPDQIAHQLARILEAGEITVRGEHPHSCNEINPPYRLQGRDKLGERPIGYCDIIHLILAGPHVVVPDRCVPAAASMMISVGG
jgi:hypothetical protein